MRTVAQSFGQLAVDHQTGDALEVIVPEVGRQDRRAE
jgi:hypothetical protein